jgi:hypothetical protein
VPDVLVRPEQLTYCAVDGETRNSCRNTQSKGEVVISSKQGEFYVASVYQPTVERKRAVESPGVLSALLRQEVVTEEVPGPPSASLARPTTEIRITDRVEIGDYVGNN